MYTDALQIQNSDSFQMMPNSDSFQTMRLYQAATGHNTYLNKSEFPTMLLTSRLELHTICQLVYKHESQNSIEKY